MTRKHLLFLLFTFLCFTVSGQTIEYRNDSLFVNNTYVNAQTTKAALDSLLKSKGKIKKSKADIRKCPASNKKVFTTTYFYHDLGLFFRKFDCDTTALSVGIKLYYDTDSKFDKSVSELRKTFNGQLIIAGNVINDKREIRELEQMQNCRVTITKLNAGSYETILGGDIFYGEQTIRLAFDSKTNKLTSVFFHYGFKNQ